MSKIVVISALKAEILHVAMKLFRSVAVIGYCFAFYFPDYLTLRCYKNAEMCEEIEFIEGLKANRWPFKAIYFGLYFVICGHLRDYFLVTPLQYEGKYSAIVHEMLKLL